MKGTIFERGNSWKNKLHRHAAWFRAKSYVLCESPKDYKRNVLFMFLGFIVWAVGMIVLPFVIISKVQDWILERKYGVKKRKEEGES